MKHSLLALLLFVVTSRAANPIAIGSRRELFVDKLLIEKMEGASLRMHAPQAAGVAVKFDQPWEGRFSGYITVIHDETLKKFRMYYRGNAGVADGASGECTCYAESDDGIRWTKPKLGLHEIGGSRDNNVMLANMPPFTSNFSPFLDHHTGVPAEERYKALAGLGGKFGGLSAFASGDGMHWRKMHEGPVLSKGGAFDTQNVSFWSEAEQCYAAYFRIFTGGGTDEKTGKPMGVRWMSRATSQDFIHWSTAVAMTSDRPLFDHIYVNQTQPYFRAPHLYIATAARFMQGKAVLSAEEKSQLADDTKKYPALVQDCSEAVLMTSRAGTTKYDRTFMEALIRPGLDFRNWTSRSNYPACGIVQTGKAELSMYVEQQYGQTTAQLRRFTLRLDGFASLHADYAIGEMITKPLTFTGSELHLNLATGAAGSVAVEIQDAAGQPIPGFALADCTAITGDDTDRVLTWKSGANVSALAGKAVRLRWVLKDADVFAFSFQ